MNITLSIELLHEPSFASMTADVEWSVADEAEADSIVRGDIPAGLVEEILNHISIVPHGWKEIDNE